MSNKLKKYNFHNARSHYNNNYLRCIFFCILHHVCRNIWIIIIIFFKHLHYVTFIYSYSTPVRFGWRYGSSLCLPLYNIICTIYREGDKYRIDASEQTLLYSIWKILHWMSIKYTSDGANGVYTVWGTMRAQ